MIKKVLTVVLAALAFTACGTNSYNQKKYQKYHGISYEEYEKERRRQNANVLDVYESGVYETEISDAASGDNNFIIEDMGSEVVESSYSSYGEAVVVMASKKIFLGRDAAAADMRKFQTALDTSYKTALSAYKAEGFTYAISPAGAVNPLSMFDVQCILAENSSNTAKGKSTCDMFFQQIPLEYEKEKTKQ